MSDKRAHDVTEQIRKASIHLVEPTWTTAREHYVLSAVRHRQQRGRTHRMALLSACASVALVMLFFVQFRSPQSESRSPERSATASQPAKDRVVHPERSRPPVHRAAARGEAQDLLPSAVQTQVKRLVVKEPPKSAKDAHRGEADETTAASPRDSRDEKGGRVADGGVDLDGVPSVDALWEQADHQRAGGHYDQAITTLEMQLANYPSDSRAFLAAFTLGRTLEASGKERRRVARAFERSYDLSPHGPLARDALRRALSAMRETEDRAEISRLEKRWQATFGNEEAAKRPERESRP